MDWSAGYYKGIEHVLWSPRDFGLARRADNAGKLGQLMHKVRRLENSLNHVLEVFCALAPPRLVLSLLGEEAPVSGLVSVHSGGVPDHEVHSKTVYSNVCQPDLFFVGDGFRACIEMKVEGGHCRLEQVLKYATLLHLYPHAPSISGRRRLLLLGPSTFRNLWRGQPYETVSDMKVALAGYTDDKLARRLAKFGASLELARQWAADLPVSFLSYGELHERLRVEETAVTGRTEADGVYRALLLGMAAELRARGYGSSG